MSWLRRKSLRTDLLSPNDDDNGDDSIFGYTFEYISGLVTVSGRWHFEIGKRATKIPTILKNIYNSDRLEALPLTTFEKRRIMGDLTYFVKIVKVIDDFN